MSGFLSCDWGTSSFRLKWIESLSGKVIAERKSGQGIKKTFESWKMDPSKDRVNFFSAVIQKEIDAIAQETRRSLKGLPVVLSGMASSSIGMIPLPYAHLPFSLDGSSLVIQSIFEGDAGFNQVILVSGVQKEWDVMRGEEIQLMGWNQMQTKEENCTLILPGTHSKHLTVKKGQMLDFKTYMTGELFDLMISYSILKNSVDLTTWIWEEETKAQFVEGVKKAQEGRLTHDLFSIRAKQLLGKLPIPFAGPYLSGLLIGTELQHLTSVDGAIVLAADEKMNPVYATALEYIDLENQVIVLEPGEVDHLVVLGQLAVWKNLFNI